MRQTSTQGVRIDRYTGAGSGSATGSDENPTHSASSPTDFHSSAALTLDTSNSDYIVDRPPEDGSDRDQQQQHAPQQQHQQPQQRQRPQLTHASTSSPLLQQREPDSSPVTASPTTPVGDKKDKKLRRLFGLGGGSGGADRDSSSSTSNPSSAGRLFGRTFSTRNRPNRPVSQQILSSNSSSVAGGTSSNTSIDHDAQSLAGRNSSGRKVLTKQRPTEKGQQDRSLTSRPRISHPAPIAEDGAESRSSNNNNPAFRHSIAILPSFDAEQQLQHQQQQLVHTPPPPPPPPQSPHESDLPSPSLHSIHSPASETGPVRAPYSVFNTSAAQSPDIDEGGSKPSSLWSGSRAPGSTQYQAYNGSQYLHPNESRPSSRQSIEVSSSSPTQSQQFIAYHPRAAVSSPSVNKLDISRDPSPLHAVPPSLQRGQSSQSTGTHLDVDNPGKKLLPKSLGMVQNGESLRGGTPPPSKSKEDLASLDFPQLLSKHEELNEKYRKVKKYYFEKDAQVTNLQNTLAHQRLSQSRTSLDDNEYTSRFQRLDGAINNLAFNVRKDWKAVPPWLSPYVNNDAAVNKSKEMTAVGRACISRWLVDEIFDRVFHPGLEPNLSSNLKIIERNLRRFAPPVNTDDERDALLTKISNWRLATLDGLQEALNLPPAAEYRTELTRGLVETLTSDLQMNLNTPPPVGLEAGVVGIIELAVGVAANLPLESRDVYVEYILPGVPYQEAYMKVEGNLPALVNPGESYPIDGDPSTQQRRGSADEVMAEDSGPPIGGFVGAGPRDRKGNGQKKGEDERREIEKVRFAAFMSVMVKGKSMLVKAPVFV